MYHLITPDYTGVGFNIFLENKIFEYAFENISKVIEKFVDQLGLTKFSIRCLQTMIFTHIKVRFYLTDE